MSLQRIAAAAALLAACAPFGGIALAAPVIMRSITPRTVVGAPEHRVFGIITAIAGPTLSVRLRGGRTVRVDASAAFARDRVAGPLFVSKPVVIRGNVDSMGTVHATSIARAHENVSAWGVDR